MEDLLELEEPVSVADAKNRFTQIAAQVQSTGVPRPVQRYGAPYVVIAPAQNPEAARKARIAAARRQRETWKHEGRRTWSPGASDKELLEQALEGRHA